MNIFKISRRRATLPLALICALFYSASALAAQPSSEDIELFQQHLAQGGQFLEEGRYPEAIEALESAQAIIEHPRIALSIAGAYRDWGRCQRSRHEYEALSRVDGLDEETKQRLERGLGRLDDCVERAQLSVQCTPEGGEFFLDGEAQSCPFEADVEVGERELKLSAQGYQSERRIVEVLPLEGAQVSMVLQEQEEEEEEAPAKVEIREPKAQKEKIPPVVLWTRVGGYTALGLGVGALAGGVISDLSAGGRVSEMAQSYEDGDFSRIEELERMANSARLRTILLYSGGALFIATGIVLSAVDVAPIPDAADFVVGLSPQGLWARMRW